MPPWASPARIATAITAAAAATPTLPGVGFLPALDPEGVVTCHFLFLSHRGPASCCSRVRSFFFSLYHTWQYYNFSVSLRTCVRVTLFAASPRCVRPPDIILY